MKKFILTTIFVFFSYATKHAGFPVNDFANP